jgi:amino acid adenylation domain-containing protein
MSTEACFKDSRSQQAPADVSTLIDLLRQRALDEPERTGYTFLADGEEAEISLTYSGLDTRARAIAALLQDQGETGPVLLLYQTGLEYISAFFGCLYAGSIAVPAYPPKLNRHLLRVQSIVADAQIEVALTTSALLARLEHLFEQAPELRRLRWLTTDDLDGARANDWREPSVGRKDLALLQYTSGSTSSPKGVMVTHDNLLCNERMIQLAFDQTAESITVGWLPLYHDMGLIGNVLQPLYSASRCIFMSPTSFLQRPVRWLRAIARYRATTSGGPNFAYELCADRIDDEERRLLDLSSWVVAYNGSEPIRASTIEKFARAYAPCGFRAEAFLSCYGLAEATLFVSGKKKEKGPLVQTFDTSALERRVAIESVGAAGRSLVSCGEPAAGQCITIVDPETLIECPPGCIGEVWISGPNVARGYWNRLAESGSVFGAHLADTGAGPFLRTGDLGFLRGELFITGRLKDLIIIRGRNHYPQDIELTVERSHPSLRPGGCAAFSIEDDGEEQLVVVQEVNRHHDADLSSVIQLICQAIAEEHEIQVHNVALIKAGELPKTSSGKIQRHACREKFLSRSLHTLAEWELISSSGRTPEALGAEPDVQSLESINTWLTAEIATKLGVDPSTIDVHRPISAYSLDSLAAVELTHRIEACLGAILPMASLLQSASIAEIAQQAQLAATAAMPARKALTPATASVSRLSHGQQALWFLDKLAPDSSAYTIASFARIVSPLDVPALQRAFQKLVDRHPSLRATFSMEQDEPVQRVLDYAEVSFQEIDASEWSEAELRSRVVEETHRRFDLEHGPILRAQVFARSKNDHILLLVLHHIVADLWSLTVLTNELGILYSAEVSGTPAHLPSNPIEYTDYALRRNEMLMGQEGERLWSYWREQLSGELPVLEIPTDHPRPPVQTYRGASQAFKLSEELTRSLKDLSVAHGTTLYVTLLAAFQTLLFRCTGQQDILVGTPTSGRNQNGLAGVIGYFVNPVVLRARPSSTISFTSFLEETKQSVLSALAHQDFPFPLLVERLQPERESSRSPLFQVMFTWHKAQLLDQEGLAGFALGESGARIKVAALELESMALDQKVSQFDLTLSIVDREDTLSGSLQYNTDLFEPRTIAQMVEHLKTLLQGIVVQPQQRLSEMPLLTGPERQQVLYDWNQTAIAYPKDLCLQDLFETQAALTPSATALTFDRERMSYAELNARANRLAHYLRVRGVGAESRVGILMERSVELVVSLLAVLKAGAAYVPLDPDYPEERLRFMLADSEGQLVLTNSWLTTRWPIGDTTEVINLDTQGEMIAVQSDEDLGTTCAVSNLAYVIYTSGSTGVPKGVMITHAAICNHMRWMAERFPLSASDRVLQKTPISFDASVWEFYAPLLAGARLVIADPDGHRNPAYLVEVMAREGVTVAQMVPSLWRAIAEEPGLSSCRDLRLAFSGGEALAAGLAERLSEATGAEVYNLYGPTEVTIDATCGEWAGGDGESVPIGRPVSNTQAYVLDSNMSVAPVGLAGELYLGGAQLARGYLKRPGLTAERFVPNPFSGEAGARLYRSGDMVKYLPDGNLEYLGREDGQVKVRGFRIELGEVDAVLRRHQSVRAATTLVIEHNGEKRLVAYVVIDERQATESGELRTWMLEQLPKYMVPQAFVRLDELPLTANGKIDRRALLAFRPDFGSGTEVIEPRTETEVALAEIWREILRVDRVSITDNFFEAGGHSLMATRLMSQVTRRFGVEVALREFFENATVEGLATHIDLAIRSAQILKAPPIKRMRAVGNPPLSFAQQRLWFLNQLDTDNTAYNMPAAARLRGQLNIEALEQSLTEIIRRHEIMRTIFVMEDDAPVQIVLPAQPVQIPLIDLSHISAHELEAKVKRLATAEAQQPFDLSRGPLIRFKLLRVDHEEHILLLTVHHIVFDGWSTGLLISELSTLYSAYDNGNRSPLPDLPVQYADYAVWQREWLQGEVLDQQLSYWKKQLAGAPEALNLPADKPRPATGINKGARQSFELSPALVDSLKILGQNERATLFMVLLAAFQVLLSRYTGQADVIVGAAVSNRNRAEIEGLIGFFVNMLVMRGDLSGDPGFSDYLRKVRDVALEAYAHQDLPFESLVESLPVGRALNRTPLFQVAFVLQNEPTTELKLPGIELSPVEVEAERTQFDLWLSMNETMNGGIFGTITYSSELFYPATIERMQEHFKTLLQGIVAHPEQRLSKLPLLTESERRQLLVSFNETRRDYPCLPIPNLFEQQVRRAPNSIALVYENEQLTYAELNAKSNRLAHRLRRLGIGAESRVAVMLERSTTLIVSILAVLKAGAAYVPLDPAYPLEPIRFMLEDSGAELLLTDSAISGRLVDVPAHTLCLDREWEKVSAESDADPVLSIDAANLCYIIYTSGSTGRPRGVAVTHNNVSRLVFAQSYATFGPAEIFLLLAPICFDASTFELWGALLHGARLAVMPAGVPSLDELEQALRRHQVTTLWLTAGLFHQVVEQRVEALKEVRQLLTGGDVVSPAHAASFLVACPGRLINGYGPTEATTFTCCYAIDAQSAKAGALRIGAPISNARIYILDGTLQPVPIGVCGELYIGGDGLARGYFGCPARTAEKFVPDPFSAEAGTRLYRTGDIARWAATGEVEFVGRQDGQVKVRGFRVELGEVEAAILSNELVKEAVVIAHDEDGSKRLVAYVVTQSEGDIGAGELRRFLSQRLPEHMIPSLFVEMPALPLTPNGKIDRKALPPPEVTRLSAGLEYVAPQTYAERVLCGIWSEVLGVELVGINDNFFELGGHSLLATRALTRIREIFPVDLPLRSFFESATVSSLVKIMSQTSGGEILEETAQTFLEIEQLSEEEVRTIMMGQPITN